MDIVVISVTQLEEPTCVSVHRGNSFLQALHASVSRSQSRNASYALLHKYFLLDVYLVVHIIIIPNQILNYCIRRVTLTWSGCGASIINVRMAAEDSCIARSGRITAPALSFFEALAARGCVEQQSRKNILQPNCHKQD